MSDMDHNVLSEEEADHLTQNTLTGLTHDGVDEEMVKATEIEDIISQFGDIEDLHQRSYKTFLFASLSWSYKFKLARTIIRLLDQNAGMADAQERNQVQRIEALAPVIIRTETAVDELQNLYNWAASQTKEDLLPLNADVIAALQVEQDTPKDEILEYAEMMGITVEEAKEDLETVTNPEVERAVEFADKAAEELEQRTDGNYELNFPITDWNAVSTMEKIAEKAEAYALKSKQLWRQNRRKSKKAHLIANVKAFEAIMNRADDLAVAYRNDVELQMARAQEMDTAAHEGSNPVMA